MDLDNAYKALYDALKGHVILDDRQVVIHSGEIAIVSQISSSACHLTITPVQESRAGATVRFRRHGQRGPNNGGHAIDPRGLRRYGVRGGAYEEPR